MKTHRVGSRERFHNLCNPELNEKQLGWKENDSWRIEQIFSDFQPLTLSDRCRSFLVGKFSVVEENENFMFLTTSNKTRFVVNSVVYDFVNWSKTSTILAIHEVSSQVTTFVCAKALLFRLFTNKSSTWIWKTLKTDNQNYLDEKFRDVACEPRPLSGLSENKFVFTRFHSHD